MYVMHLLARISRAFVTSVITCMSCHVVSLDIQMCSSQLHLIFCSGPLDFAAKAEVTEGVYVDVSNHQPNCTTPAGTPPPLSRHSSPTQPSFLHHSAIIPPPLSRHSSPTQLSFLPHSAVIPPPLSRQSSPTQPSVLPHLAVIPPPLSCHSSPTQPSFLPHSAVSPPPLSRHPFSFCSEEEVESYMKMVAKSETPVRRTGYGKSSIRL